MKLKIYIHSLKEKPEIWRQVFHHYFPEHSFDIEMISDRTDYSDADFIIQGMDTTCIDPKRCPNLKAIASPGAGVDHILFDGECHLVWPENIPVIRVRDQMLGFMCSDYALMRALFFNLHMHSYRRYQQEKRWSPHRPGKIKRIGVLGMGDVGMACALRLKDNLFEVCGWRKHKHKDNQNIPTYTGEDGLVALIQSCNLFVNALPLTNETHHLLKKFHFEKMPVGSCFVNLGRGENIVEEDLLYVLGSGHLSRAYLDVFEQEPLPENHPYWENTQLHITPHVAGKYIPNRSAADLAQSFRLLLEGKPVPNKIDYQLKY
ncbi:MAG: NAD(P)-dependent oxidoreductase [Alphaproteobacteria bacterium]